MLYTVTVRTNQAPKIERRAPKYRTDSLTETIRSRKTLADISYRLSEPVAVSPSDTAEYLRHTNAQFAIDALLLSELSRVA